MDQLSPVIPTRKHRRRFTLAFKHQVLDACEVPGQSVASVARQYDLNANLLHKWRREHRINAPTDFVRLPEPVASTVSSGAKTGATVRIELSRGLVVHWPITEMDRSVSWLKAMMA